MDLTPAGDDLRREDEPQPADSRPAPDDPFAPDTEPGDGDPFADALPYGEPPDDDFADEPWQAPPYVAPAAIPRRRSLLPIVTSILMVVLALGIVAATTVGVLEYRRRAEAQHAALQAIALIGDAAPPEIIQDVNTIQARLQEGRSSEAGQLVEALRAKISASKAVDAGTPGAGAGPAGPGAGIPGADQPIPEEAYKDLKQDQAVFFREHQDLFRQFLIMCAQARELKAQGVNVDKLREVRDQVLEAARMGLQPGVEQHMATMAQMLGGQGGGRTEGPGPLAQKAARLQQAAQRAEQQGRDIRPVVALMQKADQAASAGRMKEAEKYLDQALAAARNAPRGRAGRSRGGDFMRPRIGMREGPRNPMAPFARVLLGLMGTEEANLKVVTDQLLSLQKALIREAPPASPQEELKPMVERAIGEMQVVANRRQDLARAMQGQRDGKRPPLPTGPQQQLSAEQRRTMFAIILDRVSPILDELRGLSDEDYQKQKRSLVQRLVQAVIEPPRPEGPAIGRPVSLPTDPEQRVRARMLEASKILKQWELQGKDTTEVEKLFTTARQDLYAKRFEAAEKLVDEARKLLGMDQDTDTTAPPPGEPPVDDLKLDLRNP